MSIIEKAGENFKSGMNCAQSVVAQFAEKYGADADFLIKVSSGFGGGVKSGEICGAILGGVMAIGLKYGDDKLECGRMTKEFVNRFREQNGAVTCRDLLKNTANRLSCTEKVKSAVQILCDMDI